VKLIENGEISDSAVGKQGVVAARKHHQLVIRELAEGAFRLSNGEPAIPTTFV